MLLSESHAKTVSATRETRQEAYQIYMSQILEKSHTVDVSVVTPGLLLSISIWASWRENLCSMHAGMLKEERRTSTPKSVQSHKIIY